MEFKKPATLPLTMKQHRRQQTNQRLWPKYTDFIVYNLTEKFFWQHDTAICKLFTKGCKLILCVLFCGCVAFMYRVVSRGGKFEDIASILPFVAGLPFGLVVVHTLESAAGPGRNVWNYMNSNRPFSYSKQKTDRIKYIHKLFVKGFILYIYLMIVGCFTLCEFANCDDPTNYTCGIIYPNFLFINLSVRPYRELFNIAALGSLGIILFAVLIACSFLHLFAMIAADALAAFILQLVEVAKTKDPILRRHKLIQTYKLQHIFWKAFQGVANIFKWPLLLQYLISGIIMGFILISALIQTNLVQSCILLFAALGCLSCGLLSEEFAQISQDFQDATFYGIPWDGDIKTARFLIFMNINLRKRLVMPLGNYAVYSNKLVLLVFKAVYSTVMLYINMRQKLLENNPL